MITLPGLTSSAPVFLVPALCMVKRSLQNQHPKECYVHEIPILQVIHGKENVVPQPSPHIKDSLVRYGVTDVETEYKRLGATYGKDTENTNQPWVQVVYGNEMASTLPSYTQQARDLYEAEYGDVDITTGPGLSSRDDGSVVLDARKPIGSTDTRSVADTFLPTPPDKLTQQAAVDPYKHGLPANAKAPAPGNAPVANAPAQLGGLVAPVYPPDVQAILDAYNSGELVHRGADDGLDTRSDTLSGAGALDDPEMQGKQGVGAAGGEPGGDKGDQTPGGRNVKGRRAAVSGDAAAGAGNPPL